MSRPRPYEPKNQTKLQREAAAWVIETLDELRAPRQHDHVVAVTFQPNRRLGPEDAPRLRKLVSTWGPRVCEKILRMNRRTMHRHAAQQPVYLLVYQPGDAGWHFHGVALVPRRCFPDSLRFDGMKRIWKEVTGGGSLDLDFRPDPYDGQPLPAPDTPIAPTSSDWREQLEGWANYMVRKLRPASPFDPFLFPDPALGQGRIGRFPPPRPDAPHPAASCPAPPSRNAPRPPGMFTAAPSPHRSARTIY